MKKIALIGSTGSIGISTLQIVRAHPDRFRVEVLAARKNAQALLEQAKEFKPSLVCLYEKAHAAVLEKELKKLKIRFVTGREGLLAASTYAAADQVLFALVGAIGLEPIFAAIKARKSVAVANKEPLVMAGSLLMKEARKRKVEVLPIDSEHSGLWQCLEGRQSGTIRSLWLTSSGGPFRAVKGSLAKVTLASALKHPKWKMGPKITIDSATLMNKGLEVIEAVNLFGMPADKVKVLIHPEAIVHAMVEFVDGSHLAHLGVTDMRLPIQYALTYPDRLDSLPSLNFSELRTFHFEEPDTKRFPCLELGYEASRAGGSMPAVLNAANEIAVEAFLKEEIGFLDIPEIIEKVMHAHQTVKEPGLQELLALDSWAREKAKEAL